MIQNNNVIIKNILKRFLILLCLAWQADAYSQLTMSQITQPIIGFQSNIDLDAQYPIIAIAHNVGPIEIQGSELVINFALGNTGTGGQPILFQQESYFNPVIPPGDTIGVPLIFSLPSSVYFAYGGGSTIVVWPGMISFPTLDSLEIPIFIIPFSGTNSLVTQTPSVYPNPVNNGAIYIMNIAQIREVELFDMLGKKVFVWNSIQSGYFSLPAIPPGVYWLHITNDQGVVWREKLVVNH